MSTTKATQHHRCSATVRQGSNALMSSCWRAATAVVDGRGYCARHHPDRIASAAKPPRTIAICGGCACGIAYVHEFNSLDSGTTLTDEAGHKHVISISSPEEYAKVLADIAAAHTELAQLKIKSALALRLLEFLQAQTRAELGLMRWPDSKDYSVELRRMGYVGVRVTRKTALEALEAALNAAAAP